MSGVWFTLPASFGVSEFFTSPRLMLRADDARWLVSTIVRKTASKDTDPWGCVRLHRKIMRRIMYEPTMSDVIAALEAGGAIETYPYRAGVKSKGYRLAQRYLGDRCIRVRAVDRRLIERLEAERQRLDAEESQGRWKPIHSLLDLEQRKLTIAAAADAILDGLPEHCRLCQHFLVTRLRHREFSFSVSSTGRVFNAITGLKRELRSALQIGGEPLGSVDIRCAQPALLAMDMDLKTPTNGLKKLGTYKHRAPLDRLSVPSPLPAPSPAPSPVLVPARFASLVFSGGFYEHLMGLTGMKRESVKRAFLRDVLAKKGRYPSAVETAFREAFPDVYAFVRYVNRRDHGELIRRLQRLESWLVIEQVAPRLIGGVPVVTLHDAIYSSASCLPAVESAFSEVFGALGFRLALKCERPTGF